MGYTKRIICLAKSFKHGGICVAGRELTPRGIAGWIRPVSHRPTAELTYLEYRYQDGSSPKLLDVLDIPLLQPIPHRHQTENHLIDPTRRWTKQREITFHQAHTLIESPATLWTNQDHTAHGLLDCVSLQDANRHTSSLYLIEKPGFTFAVGPPSQTKRSYRGCFQHNGVQHNLSVTDPKAREHFDQSGGGRFQFPHSPSVYLCISLTEPYEWDGRCHKLIAAVITDPPLGQP